MENLSKEEFNKRLNISYVDESLPKPDKALALKHWLCSLFLYFGIYVILLYNPFLNRMFNEGMQTIAQIFIFLYATVAPIIYIVVRPKSLYASHSIEIYNYLSGVVKNIFCKDSLIKADYKRIIEALTPKYREKQAIMLIFIKTFFGTLMVDSFCRNIGYFIANSENISNIFLVLTTSFKEGLLSNNADIYNYFISLLFTLDIMIFIFGYLTELSVFRNKIRTVETSAAGIIFCLACYPPFNEATGAIVGWNQQDNVYTPDGPIGMVLWGLRIIGLSFLCIYVTASWALGTKASNMTNRGTVSCFPYNIVRHPAYISKNTFWLCTTIPVIILNINNYKTWYDALIYVITVLTSFTIWAGIYYFRAITEERHMMMDPDYREYAKKVKYRFIPYIW